MGRVCLIIIDGFGIAPPGPGNARTQAQTPFLDALEKKTPWVAMNASGADVGLPDGQQGASEPGHLTIGAGRIVWQPLAEIDHAIASGDFYKNDVLVEACDRAISSGKTLHLVGLYSSGGVHSSVEHFHAMLKLAKQKGVSNVMLHLFGDGRDVQEQYFCTDIALLQKEIDELQLGVVASLVGRYFAMDRDRQYADRTKVAYDLLIQGQGEEVSNVCDGAKSWYIEAQEGEDTDYYIRPLKTPAFSGIKEDDVVVCVNFRSDRMIQIVRALEEENFSEFPRPIRIADVSCMGPYSDHLPVAFPPQDVPNGLGETVSKAGLKQLRIAETDKFAHVTFFMNAQRHDPYKGEDRIAVESPKVSNFAEAPEMSASDITKAAIENLGAHDLIVMNYANPDLVGHGGDVKAAITACETVDQNIAQLVPVLEEAGYDWIITADHGNSEEMYYPGSEIICPSHTTNQVQTFVHSSKFPTKESIATLTGLKDIAPLCLQMLDLKVPEEMK